ncbi:ATP-binding protein [Streptomyces microflavus]|uniref:ATP-binding protein n=1 Tax=Streptomyces microflavus TaxID=1919 RepID=UPI003656FBB0
MCLAVREAEANAVLHGNRLHPGRRVRLDWETQEGRVRVTVGDEGDGFTPPPPTGKVNLGRRLRQYAVAAPSLRHVSPGQLRRSTICRLPDAIAKIPVGAGRTGAAGLSLPPRTRNREGAFHSRAKPTRETRIPRPERFCLGTLGGAGGTRTQTGDASHLRKRHRGGHSHPAGSRCIRLDPRATALRCGTYRTAMGAPGDRSGRRSSRRIRRTAANRAAQP